MHVADCDGDGVEDLVVLYRAKGSARTESAVQCLALEGRTGRVLWDNHQTQVNWLFNSSVVGRWLLYSSTGVENCRLIDLRTGRLISQASVDSGTMAESVVGFLAGRERDGGIEILAYRTSGPGAFLVLSSHGQVLYRADDLNRDCPGAFDGVTAVLIRKSAIEAWDRHLGRILWSLPARPVRGAWGADVDGECFVAAASKPPRLTCLSRSTGAPLWSVPLPRDSVDTGNLAASPSLGADRVAAFLGKADGVGLFDRKTGSLLHKLPYRSNVSICPLQRGSTFVVREEGSAAGYSFSSSSPLWHRSLRYASVQRRGATVFLLDRLQKRMEALEAETGKLLWSRPVEVAMGALAPFNFPTQIDFSWDNRLLFLTSARHQEVLSGVTGQTLKRFDWTSARGRGAFFDPRHSVVLSACGGQNPGGPIGGPSPSTRLCCEAFGGAEPYSPADLDGGEAIWVSAGADRLFVLGSDRITCTPHPCTGPPPGEKQALDPIADFLKLYEEYWLEITSTLF